MIFCYNFSIQTQLFWYVLFFLIKSDYMSPVEFEQKMLQFVNKDLILKKSPKKY
jgi:hypothetical protein